MTKQTRNTVRVPDMGRERLRVLHDSYGMTWREIATLEEYGGVPPGSLCTYAKTGYLAPKHRRKVQKPRPRRVAVHCSDVDSAVNTLWNNFDIEFLEEVIWKLATKVRIKRYDRDGTMRRLYDNMEKICRMYWDDKDVEDGQEGG